MSDKIDVLAVMKLAELRDTTAAGCLSMREAHARVAELIEAAKHYEFTRHMVDEQTYEDEAKACRQRADAYARFLAALAKVQP